MSQPVCATCRHSFDSDAKVSGGPYVECRIGPPVVVTAINGRAIGGFPLMTMDAYCSRYEDKRPQPAPLIENKVLASTPDIGPTPLVDVTIPAEAYRAAPSAPLRKKLPK